jgi:choline transport protein
VDVREILPHRFHPPVLTRLYVSYVCIDAATHLSEEIDKPGTHVPRAIVLATVLALVCNVAFTLAALFAVQSIDTVMASELPIYDVLSQAIPSDGAVLFLLIWLDLVFISTVPGALLTTGRLVWAFARDGGLPHSPFFGRISNRYQVPVNATLLSTAFCLLFGLIYIGSTVAFNTFISSAIVFAFLSYAVPQGLLLLAGRDTLPERYFDLGDTFGMCINVISVVFVFVFSILFCFPFSVPTSVTSMNYVSVVSVAASLLIAASWLGGGKKQSFTGPVMLGNILQGIDPGPNLGRNGKKALSHSKACEQDD